MLILNIVCTNNSPHNLTSTSQITSNIKYCNFTVPFFPHIEYSPQCSALMRFAIP